MQIHYATFLEYRSNHRKTYIAELTDIDIADRVIKAEKKSCMEGLVLE